MSGSTTKKQCIKCLNNKNTTRDFYISYSPIHSDGRVPVCNLCLKEMLDHSNIENSLKEILQMIDKPYIYSLVESTKNEPHQNFFGKYMKNCNMKQWKGMTWKDSILEKNDESMNSDLSNNKKNSDEFLLTDNLLDKWGEGYTSEHYRLFEKKYERLIRSYGEKTELHVEGLYVYIRFRVQEEMSSAKGNVKEAKEWAALAAKAAQDAKINVSQLSKSDISGGVDVLSQLFEAAETEASIIPLLPKLLEQPFDDADMVIWANINYYRTLEDKPRVSYREIWDFYDIMLNEHFEQQGFTDAEKAEFKEKRNFVFRDLGQVYIEPLHEERGD